MRPVSVRQNEEVSEYERQYEDGSDPRVLDIIDVPLIKPAAKYFQQENWLLDPDKYWTLVGRMKWKALVELAEDPARLWINESNTYHGLNDQMSLETAQKLKNSLVLIHVDHVMLRVFQPGAPLAIPSAAFKRNSNIAGSSIGYSSRTPEWRRPIKPREKEITI